MSTWDKNLDHRHQFPSLPPNVLDCQQESQSDAHHHLFTDLETDVMEPQAVPSLGTNAYEGDSGHQDPDCNGASPSSEIELPHGVDPRSHRNGQHGYLQIPGIYAPEPIPAYRTTQFPHSLSPSPYSTAPFPQSGYQGEWNTPRGHYEQGYIGCSATRLVQHYGGRISYAEGIAHHQPRSLKKEYPDRSHSFYVRQGNELENGHGFEPRHSTYRPTSSPDAHLDQSGTLGDSQTILNDESGPIHSNQEPVFDSEPSNEVDNAQSVNQHDFPGASASSDLVCEKCGVTFAGEYAKGNYQRHMKHHDVQYSCRGSCGKRFKRTDARLKHERRHHPELCLEPPRRRK